MIFINLLLSCGQTTEKEETGLTDVDTAQEETGLTNADTAQEEEIEIDTSNLTGTEPAEALPAPDFAALNFDNTPRNRDHLVGAPTVLWFYPFAGTPG